MRVGLLSLSPCVAQGEKRRARRADEVRLLFEARRAISSLGRRSTSKMINHLRVCACWRRSHSCYRAWRSPLKMELEAQKVGIDWALALLKPASPRTLRGTERSFGHMEYSSRLSKSYLWLCDKNRSYQGRFVSFQPLFSSEIKKELSVKSIATKSC
jgi:hypothetical protein